MGGLSPTHDYLFEAAMKSLGVNTIALPPTNLEAFHLGREYCNNGYCNPAYFTVGNLILFLKKLEKSGLSKTEIIERFVFFTVECNAPCRFGMLQTEYRMALKDCGFDDFRVLAFEHEGGLNQKVNGKGVQVNPEFFLTVVNALNLADAVNELVYATRPFEVLAGKTEEIRSKALAYLYEKLKTKKRVALSGFEIRLFDRLGLGDTTLFIKYFIELLFSNYYTDALRDVRNMFNEIEVDRFKSKTTIKITGEFWAITTVGAGNFSMFSFLEREGAVLLIEPVASLLQFLFSKGLLRHSNKKQVILEEGITHRWQLARRFRNFITYEKKRNVLRLGNYLLRREYKRLQDALGGDNHRLIHQPVLQKIANPFYNINIEGGEGYMEIAKNLYYHDHQLCHMVLSLKPFGCMPSTQSDGVQAKVIEMNKNIIYLPIETAGEGETNAQSRVLMALGDARIKARQEYSEARKHARHALSELRAFVNSHPILKSPTYVVPKHDGIINPGANFIYHVDELMNNEFQQNQSLISAHHE